MSSTSGPENRHPKAGGAAGTTAAVITIAAMAGHFAASALDSRTLHYITKPVPMAGLIALVLLWTGGRHLYARMIVAGLFLSGIGDIFMMLPDDWFVFGLGSFLVAHLFYISAFASGGVPPAPRRFLPFFVFGAAMLAFIWPNLGGMKIPVVMYVMVILTMGWRAAARVGLSGENRRLHLIGLAGAVSFIISDSVIAIGKFHGHVPAGHIIIMATYWAGQIGIAFSTRQPVFKGEEADSAQ